VQEFDGKVAVVTGGASGIGFALARRLAREGMQVMLADIESAALDDAVAEMRDAGADVHGVVTDVSDGEQMQALADEAVARFGAVHVVCNNAGVGSGGSAWDMPLSTWQWVLGVNLWGVIYGIRAFVPILLQQSEGYVVNTASVAGLVAAPYMAPYNASKHAVVAISESLHHELALAGPHVKVSVLCPAWVKTRIAESARNRPRHLADDDPAATAGGAAVLQQLIDQGMEPDAVADKVLAAMRAEQFWIFTHDDDGDFWVDLVASRLESVRGRTNPALRLP
jgi:NAD(P)-dependent dehydrogenase (short-subunit alcohol dehydrogenase family)